MACTPGASQQQAEPTLVEAGPTDAEASAPRHLVEAGLLDSGHSPAKPPRTDAETARVPVSPRKQLHAYDYHTCWLRPDSGRIVCWGGEPSHGLELSPSGVRFVEVQTSYGKTCGIRESDRQIECWGRYSAEVSLAAADGYSGLTVGGNTYCAIRRQDGVVSCSSWKKDFFGNAAVPVGLFGTEVSSMEYRFGGHTCVRRTDDAELICWGRFNEAGPPEILPPEGLPLHGLASTGAYACGIRDDTAEIVCWGNPRTAPPEGRYRTIAVGGAGVCGALLDGGIQCVTIEALVSGQNPEWIDELPREGEYVEVAVGIDHVCATRGSDEAVECWGTEPPPTL